MYSTTAKPINVLLYVRYALSHVFIPAPFLSLTPPPFLMCCGGGGGWGVAIVFIKCALYTGEGVCWGVPGKASTTFY